MPRVWARKHRDAAHRLRPRLIGHPLEASSLTVHRGAPRPHQALRFPCLRPRIMGWSSLDRRLGRQQAPWRSRAGRHPHLTRVRRHVRRRSRSHGPNAPGAGPGLGSRGSAGLAERAVSRSLANELWHLTREHTQAAAVRLQRPAALPVGRGRAGHGRASRDVQDASIRDTNGRSRLPSRGRHRTGSRPRGPSHAQARRDHGLRALSRRMRVCLATAGVAARASSLALVGLRHEEMG